jgi:hypothetical protein
MYEKFVVARTDGSDEPGGKHEDCDYFVLDLTHDKHAVAALAAYAVSCKDTHPQLHADITKRLFKIMPYTREDILVGAYSLNLEKGIGFDSLEMQESVNKTMAEYDDLVEATKKG